MREGYHPNSWGHGEEAHSMSELGRALIEDARKRLVEAYPTQVKEVLLALDDDQLWWRPNPAANRVVVRASGSIGRPSRMNSSRRRWRCREL